MGAGTMQSEWVGREMVKPLTSSIVLASANTREFTISMINETGTWTYVYFIL